MAAKSRGSADWKTRTERGYGAEHRRLKRQYQARFDAGEEFFCRCGGQVFGRTGQDPWDLGHDDDDRSVYFGPEHPDCNRSRGGKKAAAVRRRSRRASDEFAPGEFSRVW